MIATIIVIISFGLTRSIYISEADVMWQTRSGLDFFKDGIFHRPDTYSWTATGVEYISNSWLWNSLLAFLYIHTGFVGIAAFTALMTSITLGLVAYSMRKAKVSWPAILLFTCIMGTMGGIWLSGRPQLCDYFLLACALAIIANNDLTKRFSHIKVLGLFSLIIILWNNFHLTGIVGAVCFAAIYFMKQLEVREGESQQIMLKILRSIGALMLFVSCCFLTPYGVQAFYKPFVTVNSSVGIISEWLSPWTFAMTANTLSAGAIGIIAILLFTFKKSLHWTECILAIALLGIASWQARWTPFMIIMLSILIGKSLDRLSKSKPAISKSVYVKTAGIALVVTSFLFGLTALSPHSVVSNTKYGFDLVSFIPDGCKVFNDPGIGGAITLIRPDLKVSLDGRNDLYGSEEYIAQNDVAYGRGDAMEWIKDNEIGCILLQDKHLLNENLQRTPTWQLIKEDSQGAKLWVRSP